mgnify:CR=1 FL=1
MTFLRGCEQIRIGQRHNKGNAAPGPGFEAQEGSGAEAPEPFTAGQGRYGSTGFRRIVDASAEVGRKRGRDREKGKSSSLGPVRKEARLLQVDMQTEEAGAAAGGVAGLGRFVMPVSGITAGVNRRLPGQCRGDHRGAAHHKEGENKKRGSNGSKGMTGHGWQYTGGCCCRQGGAFVLRSGRRACHDAWPGYGGTTLHRDCFRALGPHFSTLVKRSPRLIFVPSNLPKLFYGARGAGAPCPVIGKAVPACGGQ